MKIGVLEPLGFSDDAISKLKLLGKVELFKRDNLQVFLHDKDILFVRLAHKIDSKLLSSSPNIKYICSPTTGLNHIDLAYCKEKKIKIISLKGEVGFLKTIRATPEHTLGLILALLRNYKGAFLNDSNSEWDRNKYRGEEIFENKIGIIGYGRVGKILSDYIKCMGGFVSFHDIKVINKKSRGSVQLESVEELIKWSKIIVLAASYSEFNGAIIGKKEFDLMKGKYFINTARAELTDENYLIEKLKSDFFKGVALDVIINEQNNENRLSDLIEQTKNRNLIITPHIGGATFDSMRRTEEFITNILFDKLYNPYSKSDSPSFH